MILTSNVCIKKERYNWIVIKNSTLGACEGSLACSTCHVICEPEYFDKMEEPSDEENDMLDLAFGLTET
jgi:ferredoxin